MLLLGLLSELVAELVRAPTRACAVTERQGTSPGQAVALVLSPTTQADG